MKQHVPYGIKNFLFIFVLPFSLGLIGCSDDDGPDDGGNTTSPVWTLEDGNPNMPTSGTITAQYPDAPAGSEISKLVDNNASTKYLTYNSSFDITWKGNSNATVVAYSLASATDSPEMDPKSWELSGSLDNKAWKVLDKQENQTFSGRKEVKSYELTNGVPYRYYKLSILNNHGGNATQIAEWVLSIAALTDDIDNLMKFSSGNTYTDQTPMGTQHLSDRVASSEELTWLKDASKEPGTFGDLTWSTFSVGSLYPSGSPTPADVNQHAIGDCCMCAVMAYLAYGYPNFIKNIIKSTDNNIFTVTLYDPKGKAVEVGVSNYFVGNEKELGAASGKNGEVTWATVLEKAVMKWKQVYGGSSDVGGIGTEYVSAIFTGNGSSFAFEPGKLSANELQRAVTVSINQRKIVIGGFTTSDKPVDNKYKTVNFHAYSFHVPKNNTYLFTMRNPWGALPLISGGYSDGTEDGLLNIADDGVIPPIIDLRICDPGAAKNFAVEGNMKPYTPSSYAPSPIRVASHILRSEQ